MHKPKNKNELYLQLYIVREMITSSRFKIIFQSYIIIIIYIYVCTYVCIYKYI